MLRLIERFFGSIEWLILALFLLVLPVIYSTQLLDPVLYSGFLALSTLILALTVIFTIKVFTHKIDIYFTKADKIIFGAALLYILVNIISSFGVVNSKEAIFHLTKETTYILLFFYLYQMLRTTEKGKDVLIKTIIIMAAIYLIIGYFQLAGSDFAKFKAAKDNYGYYFRLAIGHVISTLMNVVLFSSFLFMSLPFSIYGVLMYKKVWRYISGAVLISALFFIFILASKGIWGATALAVIIIALLVYFYLFFLRPKQTGQLLPKSIKITLLVAPLVVFLLGYLFIVKSDIKIAKMVSDKIMQTLDSEATVQQEYGAARPTSTQTRIYVWENSVKLFKENPIFGIGGGQWWIEYPKYGLDKFEIDIRNGVMLFQRPHNDFLWILSENGLVGFFFYLVIYIGILVIAFRSFLMNKEWPVRIFAGLAFAFLIGLIIDMFVSFSRERVTHNVMLISFFSLILALVPGVEKLEKQKRSSSILYGAAVLFLVISLLNVVAARQFYTGEKAARAIKYGMNIKNYNLVYRAAHSVENTLYTLDNFTTPIAYYKGVAQSSLNNMEGAKESFKEAYKINPYHLQVLNNLGTCYDLTGDKKTALSFYQKALDISPRYKEALINKAIVYYNLNNLENSMECILQVPINEKNPEKFEKTMVTICKRKAISLASRCDEDKFKKWIGDENKIKATFGKVQKAKGNFDVILLQELAK